MTPRNLSASAGRTPVVIAAILLVGYFIMALSASREQGPTFDETAHIVAGYNVWLNHDFRFDPGNGDFLKRWATLPLLFSKPAFPPLSEQSWRDAEYYVVGNELLYNPGNNPASILLQCRSMVALLGVALGALVFVCSRSLFGDLGGLISLGLFVFCPHMLAYGALVTTDLAFALAFLASTWLIWRLLHRVTWPGLIGSLLVFSLLLISKLSALLMAPVVFVLIVARGFNREPWSWRLGKEKMFTSRARQISVLAALALVHILIGWGTIWAAFDFRYLARANLADPGLIFTRLGNNATSPHGPFAVVLDLCRKNHLLPEGYMNMEGLMGIGEHRPSFMNGHWKAGGSIWFFPYAAWAKSPAALFFLMPFGMAGWCMARGRKLAPGTQIGPRLYEAVPFLAIFVVYAAVAVRQNLNIGFRHILPLNPVLYILAGSVALWWPLSKPSPPPAPRKAGKCWAQAAIVLLLGWFAADSVSVRPHYLAYFNGFVGGPAQGYRRLVDSSLDWGQDLPGLKRWLDAHDPDGREPIFFSYFGTGRPEYYGLNCRRLPGFPEWRNLEVFACTPGYYAISATMFQNLYTNAFGPWNRIYEKTYQTTLQNLALRESTARDSAALGGWLQQYPEEFWQKQYGQFEQLRFNRLCGWLRATHRPPDAEVGYSILIWKLDAHDLHAALWEPPLELYDSPAIKY
jgi:hypothetical protein